MAPERRRKAPTEQEPKSPAKKARTEKPAENNVPKKSKKTEPAPAEEENDMAATVATKTRGPRAVKKSASEPVVKKKLAKVKNDEAEDKNSVKAKASKSEPVLKKKPLRKKAAEVENEEENGETAAEEGSAATTVKTKGKKEEPKRASELPRPRKTVEGLVLTCGQGDVGQLGLGPDTMEKSRFAQVPGLEKVVDICAGGMHTVCLTSDGTVYTFGCDDEGALGRQATDETCFTPDKVQLEAPAVQISAGDSHSAALLEDGRVFAWGSFRDSHGTMGLKKPTEISKLPTLLQMDGPVSKIVSGSDHLLLLTCDGRLFSCGCPEQGQLGRVTARSASRDSRGGMAPFLVPKPLAFMKNYFFTDVWASSFGTFANDRSKGIFSCGLNNYHQLGLESEGPIFQPKRGGLNSTFKWVKLEGGDHHTILLESSGKVYCLGRKEYGRLGLGPDSADAHEVTPIPALENVKCVDIACGSAVSFAVAEEGSVYGWGIGSNYQLSSGDDDADVWTPRQIKAKQLEGKQVLLAAAGGQHSVLLVKS